MGEKQSPSTGLVEVFTGNGKGKTSAALGIVLRALGHGLRVHIVYFMKGNFPYGEQKILAQLPGVSFSRFGKMSFCNPRNPTDEEKEQAREALKTAREAVFSDKYDLIVMDEVNLAYAWGLVEVDEVVKLIKEKPEKVELILTGRQADPRIKELADLVTEMVEVKHPYTRGVLSRPGIDY